MFKIASNLHHLNNITKSSKSLNILYEGVETWDQQLSIDMLLKTSCSICYINK